MELNTEAARLNTFFTWKKTYIDENKLACLGMYYVGPRDRVKCYFCGVVIFNWEEKDDELGEHLKFSPHCPLLRQQKTNNQPLDESLLQNLLVRMGEDVCGGLREIRHNAVSEGNIGLPVWNKHRPTIVGELSCVFEIYSIKHPEFTKYTERLASFKRDSCMYNFGNFHELAAAGFFYANGEIRCFCCDQNATKWLCMYNKPVDVHIYLNFGCEFLTKMCQINFINTMSTVHRKLRGSFAMTGEPKAGRLVQCPKCGIMKYMEPFRPCGHCVLCRECLAGQIMCILCGQLTCAFYNF